MSKNPKHIIHNNKIYERTETDLFDSYKELSVPVKKPDLIWKGPKIPWEMWQEMVAWCQVTQEKFKSEALVFLFLDLDEKQWSHWYPPQITQGMTVCADDGNKEYKEQRKHYPDLQFGSLHHHCTAKAFASGTDHNDEIDRDGFHFTIGNLESKEHTVHFRICLNGLCYEMQPEGVIEKAEILTNLPENYQNLLHSKMILEPQDVALWDFTEPLKNVKKNKPSQQNFLWEKPTGWKKRPIFNLKQNTTNTEAEEMAKSLEKEEVNEIASIVDEFLWSYGFSSNPSQKKPFSKLESIFNKEYKNNNKEEDKINMLEDMTIEILETLKFTPDKVDIGKEMLWVVELIKTLKKHTNE